MTKAERQALYDAQKKNSDARLELNKEAATARRAVVAAKVTEMEGGS